MLDVLDALKGAPGPDVIARQAVAFRSANVLRPSGALARFDYVAAWLASWQRSDCPRVDRPYLLLAAGDHGVTGRGVSAYPQAVTRAMVDAIRAGVATSAVMAQLLGVTIRLVDVGVGEPTGDIVEVPAMDASRFRRAFDRGWEEVDSMDTDLLLVGEMGIGNTTAASALSYALYGGNPEDWVGHGSGIDAEALKMKRSVVDSAAQRVSEIKDPFALAAQLGGTELAALAGGVAKARVEGLPVVIDGFVATAAVAPLAVAVEGSLDHCFAGHLSPEPGHRLLVEKLGLKPLFDMEMRLGEGSGALAALPLIQLACAMVNDVATFEEWGLR